MDSSSNFSALKTYGGWGAILVIGLAIWYRSTQMNRPKPITAKGLGQTKLGSDVQSATASAKKKIDKALKPKPKPKPAPAATSDNAAFSTSSDYNPAADAAAKKEDLAFAQQFSKAKSGQSLTSAKTDQKKQKSVKQSRAQEAPAAAEKTSAPSSTTGDADDDLSPTGSPIVPAADSHGVSDMLEARSAGPSILRLTDTDSAKPQEKKAKPFEVAETKKQRQNRQKVEQKKVAREQEEKERKKLEEEQRRRARIAEGRPAKDGSGFVANKENAWTAKSNGDSSFIPVQPLDTFEQKPLAEATNVSTPKPAPTTATTAQADSWKSTLPSEEQQLEMVMQESAWNEVTSKKSKKTKKPKDSAAETTSNDETAPSALKSAGTKPKAPVNGDSKKSKPALSSGSSFAALTPEETTDDNDEEEVEWVV
jgi:hypothetical protein